MTKVSSHYSGETGQRYADAKQQNPNAIGYGLNFEYFKPYIKPEDAVLDFGCGNGGMMLHIKRVARLVEGLEVNPVPRALAVQQGFRVYASVDELPTAPTYDVMTSNHVLEHVRDVCSTLERVRQAMKPGGRVVIKLPFDDVHEKKRGIL